MVTKFELTQAGYAKEASGHFQRQLLERVSHLPGVQAAAYANATPLSQDTITSAVFSQQTTDLRPSNRAFYTYDYDVSPGYFAAAQTPLLEGRDVSFTDTDKTPAVAVVNQEFARELFHSEHVSAVISKMRPASPSRSWASWPMGNTCRSAKTRMTPCSFLSRSKRARKHPSSSEPSQVTPTRPRIRWQRRYAKWSAISTPPFLSRNRAPG